MKQNIKFRAVVALLTGLTLLTVSAAPANAAFHLWHVKEVFTNADGSVQFIELFNSSGGEQFVGNHTLRSNSDGVIRNFVIPSHLPNSPSTANTHMLIATPDFDDLSGAVTPNYTLPAGPFFNPNANNITISFPDSGDFMTFSGSLLPKDGFNSLTDLNAFGFSLGNPNNIQVTANTPTRFPNTAGQIDLRAAAPSGDYNGNGRVDVADYIIWRKTFDQTVTAGSGADGDQSGRIDQGDYTFWQMRFGQPAAGLATGAAANAVVPEPATIVLALFATLLASVRRRNS
jgi:hypothetical protein